MTKKKKTSQPSSDLNQCINILNHPERRIKPPPKSCYKLLRFSNEEYQGQEIEPGPNFEFIQDLYPQQVKLTSTIVVHPKNKLFVNHDFKNEMKRIIGFTITPIRIKDTDLFLALLGDNVLHDFELFIPPGNDNFPNIHKVSMKIKKLLTKKLKIPVHYFYMPIRYHPKVNTIDYPFWSSYLIHQKIKYYGRKKREQLVNKALIDVVTSTPEYCRFREEMEDWLTS